MADIRKCIGALRLPAPDDSMTRICLKREQCYRYTVEASPMRQSWMMTPLEVVDGVQQCSYFGPNGK